MDNSKLRAKLPPGIKFGRFTTSGFRDIIKNGFKTTKIVLTCDCGKERVARVGPVYQMIFGKRKAFCGCGHNCRFYRDKVSQQNAKNYPNVTGEIKMSYWNRVQKDACGKRRRKWSKIQTRVDIPFTITPQYAWDLFLNQKRKCNLTGRPIEISKTGTASLDRIDSAKGYEPGNVQWIHKDLQRMKWDIHQDEFLEWCRKVSNFDCGMEKPGLSRLAHNQKFGGSNPSSATISYNCGVEQSGSSSGS